jgi:hypothetical protein
MTLRYMRYLAAGLVTLLLSFPALSVEPFRYRGAAKDGGTLEYVFQAGEQNSPNAVTKEKAAEIAADFMTTFLSRTGWSTGNAGISDNARSILADLLLRHDQGCAPAILLRGSIARWNGR